MGKITAAHTSCSYCHNSFFVPKGGFLFSQAKQKSKKWKLQPLTGKSQMINASTYSSRISTDIPLYEIPGATFDRYLENKPRVFKAIFPDKRRSQQLNEVFIAESLAVKCSTLVEGVDCCLFIWFCAILTSGANFWS
uniref:Uncharacterized protein LOC104223191 n=1 Tax=Nicotiana sylvestris TaxID=4096 RepID=A0A1U7W2N2_NICSY|nr:PREDICTED: uncharacterized protein LOC104223191 [Nicotiana sylvestris]